MTAPARRYQARWLLRPPSGTMVFRWGIFSEYMTGCKLGQCPRLVLGRPLFLTQADFALDPCETEGSPPILCRQQRQAAGDAEEALNHRQEKSSHANHQQAPPQPHFKPALYPSSSLLCHGFGLC